MHAEDKNRQKTQRGGNGRDAPRLRVARCDLRETARGPAGPIWRYPPQAVSVIGARPPGYPGSWPGPLTLTLPEEAASNRTADRGEPPVGRWEPSNAARLAPVFSERLPISSNPGLWRWHVESTTPPTFAPAHLWVRKKGAGVGGGLWRLRN